MLCSASRLPGPEVNRRAHTGQPKRLSARRVTWMPELTKVMIIRPGEKPTIKNQPPFGVTQDGEQDWESLTVRGWLRAASLGRLFNPTGSQFPNDALDRPVS